jgi:hypothetical protein
LNNKPKSDRNSGTAPAGTHKLVDLKRIDKNKKLEPIPLKQHSSLLTSDEERVNSASTGFNTSQTKL